MHHGDEINVLRAGARIPAKALEPIGVYDGSRCWGVWVPDQRRAEMTSADRKRPLPHMLVSPIHPTKWPIVFHLSLVLNDRRGAMKDAARVLDDMNVNIVFAECSPVGYHHAVWNIVAEAASLAPVLNALAAFYQSESKWREHHESLHSSNAPDWREETLKALGLVMLSFLGHLERNLRDQNAKQIKANADQPVAGFFYTEALGSDHGLTRNNSTREQRPYLIQRPSLPSFSSSSAVPTTSQQDIEVIRSDRTSWLNQEKIKAELDKAFPFSTLIADDLYVEELGERWDYHALEPVRLLRGMQRLAYFWRHGRNVDGPVGFRYDGSKHLLVPDASNAISDGAPNDSGDDPSESLVALPTRAIASFDRVEHYVRLQFLRREEASRLMAIEMQYTSEPQASGRSHRKVGSTPSEPTSRGLLLRMCKGLEGLNLDLRRVSNRIVDYSRAHEKGSVRIVAQVPESPVAELKREVEQVVRDAAARAAGDIGYQIDVTDVTVKGYARTRVFVSMPMGFSRREDIKSVLRKLGDEMGIEPVFSETYREGTTEHVKDDLRECDGFLQLITLRDDERQTLAHSGACKPDVAWLAYEYGLADALNRKPVRVVDDLISDAVFMGTVKIARDVATLRFDTGADRKTLQKDLRLALTQIVRHLSA